MYPNINITEVVNYIIIEVFRNAKVYLTPEKDSKGYTLPIPTKAEFKLFLLSILKDFNLFTSQVGTFRQFKGLQMRTSVALLISNIFIGGLERTVIKKLIKVGSVVS